MEKRILVINLHLFLQCCYGDFDSVRVRDFQEQDGSFFCEVSYYGDFNEDRYERERQKFA